MEDKIRDLMIKCGLRAEAADQVCTTLDQHIAEHQTKLDGEYTAWGPGALSEDAHRLTFHSQGSRFSVSAALAWVDPKGVVLSQLGQASR